LAAILLQQVVSLLQAQQVQSIVSLVPWAAVNALLLQQLLLVQIQVLRQQPQHQ
jgi:hypothetical protein